MEKYLSTMYNVFIISVAFILSTSVLFAQSDQVLFEIDGNAVHVSEFDYIYNKNNGEKADYSDKSLREYLDLYTKFKLKVQQAKELGLDTLDVLQKELSGYRKQLSKSYLVDKEVSENLLKEVFDRRQKDIKASHILFAVKPNAPQEEVSEVLARADRAYTRIKNGEAFESVAKDVSDDKSSAIYGGNLGYYTSMLPEGFYAFENALYNASLGDITKPVRSRVGFHILKITDIRKAYGEVKVAHLLLRKQKRGQRIRGVRERIDSLHKVIANGGDWNELVQKYSDDRITFSKGGALDFFGINTYEKSFEAAAFSLENDNDISSPIETQIGWHIIKRLSKRDNTDFEKTRKRLSAKLSKSPRFEIAKQSLINTIKKNGGFIEYKEVYQAFLNGLDFDFYTYKWRPANTAKKTLFKFDNDIEASNIEFGVFCRKNSRKRLRFEKEKPLKDGLAVLYNEFVNDYAIKYEETRLEEKYPEFKALMREYAEGILLFEVTKLNVWDKAAKDSIGLQSFFVENREKYKWKERAVVDYYKINTTDESLIRSIQQDIIDRKSHSYIIDKYNRDKELVEVAVEKYEKGVKGMFSEWKRGIMSDIQVDKITKRSNIRYIAEILPEKLKTLEESRGYVLADFQDYLEEKWVKELENKYFITVDNDVFSSLIKN